MTFSDFGRRSRSVRVTLLGAALAALTCPQTRMGAGIAASPHCPRLSPCPKAWLLPGAGSGRGLSAPVGSLSGSSSKSRSFFPRIPGHPAEASSLSGSRRGEPRRVPEKRLSGPKSVISVSRRSPLKRTSSVSGRAAAEAKLRRLPFAVPSPEGSGSAGRSFGKWGRHRLSPPPRASSSRPPDLPASHRLSRRSADLSAFRPLPGTPFLRFRRKLAPACKFKLHVRIDSRQSDVPVDNGDIGD
jgi:hypothetical protein